MRIRLWQSYLSKARFVAQIEMTWRSPSMSSFLPPQCPLIFSILGCRTGSSPRVLHNMPFPSIIYISSPVSKLSIEFTVCTTRIPFNKITVRSAACPRHVPPHIAPVSQVERLNIAGASESATLWMLPPESPAPPE